MRHSNHRPRETVQELFQPLNTFGIQVIGRFVEQEHIRTRKQKSAQCHTALLTTRQMSDLGLPRRQTQRISGNFHLRRSIRTGSSNDGFQASLFSSQGIKIGVWLSIRGINSIELGLRLHHFAHAFFNSLSNRCLRIKLRFLRQITNFEIVLPRDLAVNLLVNTGHNLQQG